MKIFEIKANRKDNKILYTVYFTPNLLGKIYPSYDGKWVKIPNGEYTSCFDVGVYRFEPSAKSAFDAQNQPKQPIKQAVLCETQEQWDYPLGKGNTILNWFRALRLLS